MVGQTKPMLTRLTIRHVWVIGLLACGGRTDLEALEYGSATGGSHSASTGTSGTHSTVGGYTSSYGNQSSSVGTGSTKGTSGGYATTTGGVSPSDGGAFCGVTSQCVPGTCGTLIDTCGNVVDCGSCIPGECCGCGGIANSCAIVDVALTCSDYPLGACGWLSDGLGGILDCGPCSCAYQTCEQVCANPLGGEPFCQSTYDLANGWIIACHELSACGVTSTCFCRVG